MQQHLFTLTLAALFTAAQSPAPAQSVLVDLAQAVTPGDSDPLGFHALGSKTLFMTHGEGASMLWSSDGSGAGTQLVREWDTAISVTLEPHFAPLGAELLFWVHDLAFGREVWKTDGTTAGTILVKDIRPGSVGAYVQPTSFVPAGSQFTEHGGALYFAANDGLNGAELWRTDGTTAGTQLVKDLVGGPGSSSPHDIVSSGGALYFIGFGVPGKQSLYRTDGTSAGTSIVSSFKWPANLLDPGELPPNGLTDLGSKMVFRAFAPGAGYELWRSDGTPAGTQMVIDLKPAGNAQPESFVEVGGLAFFQAETDNQPGKTLFRTDGTAPGTFELSTDEFILSAQVGASTLGFFVWNSAMIRELWATDGTLAGTQYVMDAPGVAPIDFQGSPLGAHFFVVESGGSYGLWRTDGSLPGTLQLTSLSAICSSLGAPQGANSFWFGGASLATGCEPWRSDGTPAGTQLVANLAPEVTADSSPTGVLRAGDKAYFLAKPAGQGTTPELFVTDGTPAGTLSLKSFALGIDKPLLGAALNGQLIFKGPGESDIWKTDGTVAGTTLVFDSDPSGSLSAQVFGFAEGGAVVYFTTLSNGTGQRMWRTDGTPNGTFPLKDLTQTSAGLLVDGLYYFGALDALNGGEPWVSDGTLAGTQMLASTLPGTMGTAPRNFVQLGSKIYFLGTTPQHGTEVWSTDGPGGTTQLAFEIGPGTEGDIRGFGKANGKLFILAADNDDPLQPGHGELWTSLGDQASSVPIFDLPTTSLPATGFAVPGMVSAGDHVFFYAGSGLWSSDGVLTQFLQTFPDWHFITIDHSWSHRIAVGSGDQLAFFGKQPATGSELWISDGTPAGTFALTEPNNPGPASTAPDDIQRRGGQLLFSGDDPQLGRELFAVPLTQLGEYVLETFGSGCKGSNGLRPRMDPSGAPQLGGSIGVGLADAPASQPAFLFYSGSAAAAAVGPCPLLVGGTPAVVATSTSAAGTAALPFAVPSSPALLGLGLYAQWAVLDPLVPLGFVISDGLEIQIGS